VQENGLASIVGGNMERWFSKTYRDNPASADRLKNFTENFLKTDVEGYAGCCSAIAAMDHRDLLPKIKVPTLIIAGKTVIDFLRA
jgi:3-oxoadipate enol-lactonase